MPVVREALSTYTDGSPAQLSPFGTTLLHDATGAGVQYVYISMYNRGQRARQVRITFAGAPSFTTTLRAAKNTQLVCPGVALYNVGTGIAVHAAASQPAGAWTLPTNLEGTVVVVAGAVAGVVTTAYTASTDAQPLLLVVRDSTRLAGDLDNTKGTVAIVELAQQNGVVLASVLDAGRNFTSSNLLVTVQSGVLVNGYVLRE